MPRWLLAFLALAGLLRLASADVFFVWPAIGTGTEANTVVLNRGQRLNVTIDFTAPFSETRTFSAWVFRVGAGAGDYTAQIAREQAFTPNALRNVIPWFVDPAVYAPGTYYIRATAGADTRVSANVRVLVPGLRVELGPPAEAFAGHSYPVRVSLEVPTPPGSAPPVSGLAAGLLAAALCLPSAPAECPHALHAGRPEWAPEAAGGARYAAAFAVALEERHAGAAPGSSASPSTPTPSPPPPPHPSPHTATGWRWRWRRTARCGRSPRTPSPGAWLAPPSSPSTSSSPPGRRCWRRGARRRERGGGAPGALAPAARVLPVDVAPAGLLVEAPAPGSYAPPGAPLALRWAATAEVPRWSVALSYDGSNETARELATGLAGTSFIWEVPPAALIGALPSAALLVYPTDEPYRSALRAGVAVRVEDPPALAGIPASRLGVFVAAVSACSAASLLLLAAAALWWYLRCQARKRAARADAGPPEAEYTAWQLWERVRAKGGGATARLRAGLRRMSESLRARIGSSRGGTGSRAGAYGGRVAPLAAWDERAAARPPRRGAPSTNALAPPPRPRPRARAAAARAAQPDAAAGARGAQGERGGRRQGRAGAPGAVGDSPRGLVSVHRPPPPRGGAKPGRPVPVRAATEIWTLEDV
eukprot:tig00000692_g3228.t1